MEEHVYRHPVAVVLSLIRRGMEPEVIAEPLVGLCSWNVYNQCLLTEPWASSATV